MVVSSAALIPGEIWLNIASYCGAKTRVSLASVDKNLQTTMSRRGLRQTDAVPFLYRAPFYLQPQECDELFKATRQRSWQLDKSFDAKRFINSCYEAKQVFARLDIRLSFNTPVPQGVALAPSSYTDYLSPPTRHACIALACANFFVFVLGACLPRRSNLEVFLLASARVGLYCAGNHLLRHVGTDIDTAIIAFLFGWPLSFIPNAFIDHFQPNDITRILASTTALSAAAVIFDEKEAAPIASSWTEMTVRPPRSPQRFAVTKIDHQLLIRFPLRELHDGRKLHVVGKNQTFSHVRIHQPKEASVIDESTDFQWFEKHCPLISASKSLETIQHLLPLIYDEEAFFQEDK